VVLDTVTLRVAFGLMALSVLVLFYAATYRSTRSAFISFGVAELDPDTGLEASLARADAALYRAKRAGSGRVIHAE
jgi:PleD family two-component response regulator